MPNTLLIIDDDLAVQNIINAEIAIDMIILVMLKLQSILKNDCFSMKIPIQMRANIIDNKRDGNRHEEIDSLSLDAVIVKKKIELIMQLKCKVHLILHFLYPFFVNADHSKFSKCH
ncbi:hypothetical protein DQZ30_24540 [Salmonella enterica subsp. diarizonae]|nr:hypothetical protein [Salmonella enterica subsp. diarizonae]